MAFDRKRSIRQNIDAIPTVFLLEKEARSASEDEISVLKE
jgi:hypothetical protein